MSRFTVEEIFESYQTQFQQERVHRQESLPFRGRPGHYYFVNRRPTYEDLAQISFRSSHAEAALIKINDAYIVKIGNTGVANAAIRVPTQQDGIEDYQWIAHTHPLEQENHQQRVARGPTAADRIALREINSRGWDQTGSTVIICRGGRVVDTVTFHLSPPQTNRSASELLNSFTIEP